MNYFKKVKLAYKWIPILTENQLKEFFPSIVSSLFLILARILLLVPSKYSLFIVPKRFCYLMASIAYESSNVKKAQYFINKIENYSPSNKLVVHFKLSNLKSNKVSQLNQNEYFGKNSLITGKFEHLLSWGMWNYSHKEYIELLHKSIDFLNRTTRLEDLDSVRYLPEFTTNMGHLGFLTSYIGHYSKETPQRVLGIWPNLSPNKFFIELILEQSPLKIKTFDASKSQNEIHFTNKDSLSLSLTGNRTWRIEHCSGAYSGQDFPEINNGFKLKFPENIWEQPLDKLKSIGFSENKWFVTLHIRGQRTFAVNSIQLRDADIEKYREFCQQIIDLGGQVVRMGGKVFDKLSDDFPAIDYAHSSINSPELDCWLWANCKWWAGNANGAMAAAYAFGAKRLITDQWFWDNLGCNGDFYMPRLVKRDTKFLNVEETLDLELSRSMAPKKFEEYNLHVPNLESKILSNAALDMYNTVFNKVIVSDTEKFSSIEEEFNKRLRNNHIDQTMHIPGSYQNYIIESLSN